MTRALVVFHDHGAHILDRFLKPGFRHCFVDIEDGHCWISIDGRVGVPVIAAVAPAEYDLAAFYREQGFTVVEMERGAAATRLPFINANCVGIVKVILGIRAPLVLSPWQLYKYLRRKTDVNSGTGHKARGQASQTARCGNHHEATE